MTFFDFFLYRYPLIFKVTAIKTLSSYSSYLIKMVHNISIGLICYLVYCIFVSGEQHGQELSFKLKYTVLFTKFHSKLLYKSSL